MSSARSRIWTRIASPKTFTMIGALSAIALVGACSPGPMPVSQSLRDPSSPAAPEGTTPVVASAAAPGPSSSDAHGHAHHAHGNHAAGHAHHAESAAAGAEGDPQGTVYVCPMDPEVVSNAPGLCPKCNMKLVPKK